MMLRYISLLFLLLLSFFQASAQDNGGVHSWDGKLDGGLLGGGAISFGLSRHLQKKVPLLTDEEILKVDPLRVNPIDRIATRNYSPRSQKISDILLRTSAAMPVALLLDKNSRDELGIVSVMLVETTLINNGITGIFKGSFQRKRPYVYNATAPLLLKKEQNARYSFFSGHSSNSAAYSFFAAKVFADNNPDSKLKPYVWGAAIALPVGTSLFRVKAGKHFPTDVVVGYAVGATLGWLIPELHR